jgi:hypothetical protein
MSQRPEDECKSILNDNLFIHHVYGKLGKLSWQKDEGSIYDYVPFRINIDDFTNGWSSKPTVSQIESAYLKLLGESTYRNIFDGICNIVNEVRTYTESIKETVILGSVKSQLSQCEDLFFLGFGYHQENMKWFDPKGRYNMQNWQANNY